jgi:hypothetical protein
MANGRQRVLRLRHTNSRPIRRERCEVQKLCAQRGLGGSLLRKSAEVQDGICARAMNLYTCGLATPSRGGATDAC